MKGGDIYTVAGDGTLGFLGDGGPAAKAELAFPGGVAVDGAGNLVIVDGNARVRVVAARTGRFYGQAMKAGGNYTVAGGGRGGGFRGGGPPPPAARPPPPRGGGGGRAGGGGGR